MPLIPIAIQPDLITYQNEAASAVLNRQRYTEFRLVTGEPTYQQKQPQDAVREAFAALKIAEKADSAGTHQQVYVGDPAIQILYGRSKKKDEQDCDVVGYLISGSAYGYFLAEERAQIC
jgi:hypothetical protein